MILTQCELRRSVRAHRTWALGIAAGLCSAAVALSSQWDREGARRAWEEAMRQQETLTSSPSPSREMYLRAILTFQQVYLKDPHYFNSDDAVYECARLYQKMGDRFGDTAYYRNAVKLYH